MGHRLSPPPGILPSGSGDDGVIAGIDPRVRIVVALVFAFAVVACSRPAALCLALALAVIALFASGLPLRRTLKRMAAMDGFIVFMLVLLPFTVPGDELFSLAGFVASRQGLAQAVDIALKANASILMLMVLVGTMEATTLGHTLHALGAPAGLVHLVLFTVRYIEVLNAEYLRLRMAMKARGFRPANRLHTYRSFGYLVGMMLVRALERSERILDAMKCRGFTGAIPLLNRLAFRRRDFGFIIIALTALAALALLESGHAPF